MKKKGLLVALILCGLSFFPLGWILFPFAQSMGAVELSDGTKAILSLTTGTWIIRLGAFLSIVSFLTAAIVAIYYRPKQ
jgi:hypothetical protein